MTEYKPGTICSVRGSDDDWQIIGTQHDGLVRKYVLQSRNSGEVRCLFNFEVFEKYTSTYKEIDDFFKRATGIGLDENLDFLDDDLDETELQTVNAAIIKSNNFTTEPETSTLQPPSKRFKTIAETDITKLRSQNTEKTTDSSTKWAVGLLKAWMLENNFPNDNFENMETSMVDTILQQFYACLQSKKGGNYSKSALVGIRAGINRHLTIPPFSRLLNLMKDREFMASNQGLKRDGKDVSKNKEPVSENDLKKLYESGVFSDRKPETLQNKIMYERIAQFGRRGREGLQTLKKDSFVIKNDIKGRRYLTMTYNEADKTHHGLDSRETSKEPRMYEMGDKFCPLRSFEKYLSKLNPDCDRLFQRPKRTFNEANDQVTNIWYENSPLGINKINSFMSRLSEAANLSERYTNHCIRAFVSTHLKSKGFSNESIMATTGHRNVQSLTSYIKPHDDERHDVSKALAYQSKGSSEIKSCQKTELELHSQMEQPLPQAPIPSSQTQVHSVSTVSCVSGRESHIFYGAVNAGTINVNYFSAKYLKTLESSWCYTPMFICVCFLLCQYGRRVNCRIHN